MLRRMQREGWLRSSWASLVEAFRVPDLRRVELAWALSVTGIAGPDGGTAEKPVGTVYIGLAGPNGATAQRFQFLGDRSWIRTLSCQNALNLLRLQLIR
jgi:nicotinamide-nucleotide amidase